jgi:hypothetical protein
VLSTLDPIDRDYPSMPYNASRNRHGRDANTYTARSKERSEKEQVMVWLSNAGEIWDAQMYNISSLHGHGV